LGVKIANGYDASSADIILGGCRRERIFDEESITCRHGVVRNLLISRSKKSFSDSLLDKFLALATRQRRSQG
jgi:hypothetical protein